MFQSLSRFAGRSAAIGLMITGLGLATIVALGLILVQIIGTQPIIENVSCQLGWSKDCLAKELERERKKLNALKGRTAELEALYQQLSALDHAASSYSVFYSNTEGWKTVTTGIEFQSLLDPSKITDGWCYVQLGKQNGLQRNLTIARLNDALQITYTTIDDQILCTNTIFA